MHFFDRLLRLGYSSGLHRQLMGMSVNCEYDGDSVYQLTGFVALAVSIIIMLNYYYGIFNNPRFTHRRTWFLNVLTASGIAGFFSYFQAASFLSPERHCNEIHFTAIDCLLFAINEMIYTMILCFLFSLLFKWKSIANKKVPF